MVNSKLWVAEAEFALRAAPRASNCCASLIHISLFTIAPPWAPLFNDSTKQSLNSLTPSPSHGRLKLDPLFTFL